MQIGREAVAGRDHLDLLVGAVDDDILSGPDSGRLVSLPPGEHWMPVVVLLAEVGGGVVLGDGVEPDQAPVRADQLGPLL